MLYYSTLGYTPNTLIEKYQLFFIEKLEQIWKTHFSWWIPVRAFLLCPDIHSLLLAIDKKNNEEKENILSLIWREYTLYTSRWNTFLNNREELIRWTRILLTLDFHNPDIDIDLHPDHKKEQVWITFGSKSPWEWHSLFSRSFDILRMVSPGFMNEIESMIHKIIPLDVSIGKHNSWSYSNVIGHLMMSYPTGIDSPHFAILEAILHEYNHNKLNLIMQTEKLVLSNFNENYYSPYRPDARHIQGIYLWLHAIVWAYWVIWNAHINGIITLTDTWLEKSVLSVLKNWLSLQVLDQYGEYSALGKEILEEMRAIHKECLSFIKRAQVSEIIISNAKQSLIRHFQDVKAKYPHIHN